MNDGVVEQIENILSSRAGVAREFIKFDIDKSAAEYTTETFKGKPGVRVPVSSPTGGIVGSNRPFGNVVIGKTIKGYDESNNPIYDDFPEVVASLQNRATIVDGQGRQVVSKETLEKAAKVKEKKDNEMDEETRMMNELAAQINSKKEEPEEEELEEIKIRLTGSHFGMFSGTSRGVEENDEFVTVVYYMDDNIYVPPVSDQPVKLHWNGKKLELYYNGISIELASLNLFLVVFNKTASTAK